MCVGVVRATKLPGTIADRTTAVTAARIRPAIRWSRIAGERTRHPRRSRPLRFHLVSQAYVIHGGRPLEGEVTVSGATKNSALKLLAASLLAPGRTTIRRIADIADMRWFGEVLTRLGVDVTWEPGVVTVDVPFDLAYEAPYE